MQQFKAVTINTFNGDPLDTLTFDHGTHFEAGQVIATPSGMARIESIHPDEDYGCLLQLEVNYQWDAGAVHSN